MQWTDYIWLYCIFFGVGFIIQYLMAKLTIKLLRRNRLPEWTRAEYEQAEARIYRRPIL